MASLPQPQRAYPRHAVDAEISLSIGGDLLARGRTRNLSRGGLCAVIGTVVPRGATVLVSISLVFSTDGVSEPLVVPARVAWCTAFSDAVQVGLAFLPLAATTASYLDMFIRFLTQPDDDAAGDDPSPFDL
ncbi:MAG: PilZ domain-containing protein [Kofleriaceae bacterium]